VLVHRMRSIAFALLTPFYFLKAGLFVSLQAVAGGAGLIAALLLVKMATKAIGVWPLARRGILAGLVLGATRALGEFGATLMVAGNIPGQTQTLPLAVYDAVQSRQYDQANAMVLTLTALAFVARWWARQVETTRRPHPAARAAGEEAVGTLGRAT
jgi:ABC-type tungstate transport system substrate-binding protein